MDGYSDATVEAIFLQRWKNEHGYDYFGEIPEEVPEYDEWEDEPPYIKESEREW